MNRPDDILNALSLFTYFTTFDSVAKQEICADGKIKTFKPEETILGDRKGITNFVYFIMSGECQMIERLLIRVKKIGTKQIYSLHKEKDRIQPSDATNQSDDEGLLNNLPNDVQIYYMQVFTMSAGGCFGLGESMQNRRLVAASHVECLLLPRHCLMKWNPANIWPRIKHYLERKIPNSCKVFDEFKRYQRWDEYKNTIVNDVIKEKHSINNTTIHDVPYAIRLECNFDLYEYISKKYP